MKVRNIAGENVGFDSSFINAAFDYVGFDYRLPRISIDLQTIAKLHHIYTGREFRIAKNRSDLSLDGILEYVGLSKRPGFHSGIEDAKLECAAFSHLLFSKKRFGEYASDFVGNPLKHPKKIDPSWDLTVVKVLPGEKGNGISAIAAVQLLNPKNDFFLELNTSAYDSMIAQFDNFLAHVPVRNFAGFNPYGQIQIVGDAFKANGIQRYLPHRSHDLFSSAFAFSVYNGVDVPVENGEIAFTEESVLKMAGLPSNASTDLLTDVKLQAEAFHRFMFGKGAFQEFQNYPLPF